MSVLQIHDTDAAPWGAPLLKNINLDIAAGEVLGIIGPNGAGKTSLLKLMTGEIKPSRGSITLLGEPLQQWNARARAQLVATLPQFSLLNFPYTVEEVILLGRGPHSSGNRADRGILREVLEATDSVSLQGRIYTQLSGGEKQRVQLARVFAQIWRQENEPARLLLLDEPTAALDLAHQQLILNGIRTLGNSGCATVIVAHDFNLIGSIADQIIAMDKGQQCAQGSPHEVLTPEVFSRIFNVDVTVTEHLRTGRPLVLSS